MRVMLPSEILELRKAVSEELVEKGAVSLPSWIASSRIFSFLKAKYIRRTGGPGHYRYVYREASTGDTRNPVGGKGEKSRKDLIRQLVRRDLKDAQEGGDEEEDMPTARKLREKYQGLTEAELRTEMSEGKAGKK